jgi:hypothetical protein
MRILLAGLVAALMLLALPVAAQTAPQTATQFYMEYRDAWVKSKSMDTLLPYMDKVSRGQFDATPKAQRQPMFQMMKTMGGEITNVKVLKETKKGDGYHLDLTATGPDRKPATGTAEVVVESGAMKLKSESWKM